MLIVRTYIVTQFTLAGRLLGLFLLPRVDKLSIAIMVDRREEMDRDSARKKRLPDLFTTNRSHAKHR
jgi:hypothetical protein